ncbi:hypothetical protein Q8A64_13860 [Oxalobacteraceae bacterium R-40]|uniref:Uncharacterized protein n=1 Tax=Keguizhuia sedimenti TaxID=3064264 RepID=A0ABU1BRJ9_9BURK|nr:hypothetical protein [Oxalobacteraceae bacterium R-40]
MECIHSILDQLEQGSNLDDIRCANADLLLVYLKRSKATHNVLARDHLTNAVGTLTLNVNSFQQPTKAGLPLCLADLEKAIAELDDESANGYQLHRKRADAVTYDMLMRAVQAIRDKAICQPLDDEQAA